MARFPSSLRTCLSPGLIRMGLLVGLVSGLMTLGASASGGSNAGLDAGPKQPASGQGPSRDSGAGKAAEKKSAEKAITRIALGSCIRENQPQPIWKAVLGFKPQLFLLIGDNIYGDTEDMNVLNAKYAALGANPGFAAMRKSCQLLATWDDHDYGVNDGGREYPKRAESQAVFNDFYQVPADSPRRSRPGIYDAQVFGPRGKRVQVILLDTRYFRSPLKRLEGKRPKGKGPYQADPDPGKTMLGEAQWRWLGEQFKVDAQIRILASSIQVASDQHGWEGWFTMPRERQRLFNLIKDAKAEGVIAVSGDRHRSEISKLVPKVTGVSYPIFDLTSSSLNQPSRSGINEPNPHRVGGASMYGAVNFGTIEINWDQPQPTVALSLRDIDGKAVRSQKVPIVSLRPITTPK